MKFTYLLKRELQSTTSLHKKKSSSSTYIRLRSAKTMDKRVHQYELKMMQRKELLISTVDTSVYERQSERSYISKFCQSKNTVRIEVEVLCGFLKVKSQGFHRFTSRPARRADLETHTLSRLDQKIPLHSMKRMEILK